MSKLDPFISAIPQRKLDALALVPGKPPQGQRGGTNRPMSKTVLDGTAIERLLIEIAPDGSTPGDQPGPPWEFDYALGGEIYRVNAVHSPEGWQAVISPAARKRSPASVEAAGPEPAESPEPVESPEPDGAAQPAGMGGDLPPAFELLEEILRRDASDLHLSSGQMVRMRIDGSLVELSEFKVPSETDVRAMLDQILPERNAEELAATNDTDFAVEVPGRARFRANVFRDRLGLGAVFRQIPLGIPSFDQLGLPESLAQLTHLSKGLVLVTGPTGSGKSTTLAAIIDRINRTRNDHIITIEDPVEFVHPSRECMVNQREVGVHTTSFKSALRAALREDPDIVLVGEMRDLETVAIAIETAETGHLVFGTLHTTTAPSTVERVVDQFPAERQDQIRIMLAESLRAVIAQSLLKKIGGGRVAAFEILVCTPAVSNLIREGKTFQIASAMQIGKRQGMIQLNDSLFQLVKDKLVEPEEAYFKAVDKEALLAKFKAADIPINLTPQDIPES